MDATVRATCPGCRNPLRIPAEWVGRAVKCKKCGAVVRSKPKPEAPPPVETAPAPAADPNAFVNIGEAPDLLPPDAPESSLDYPLPEPAPLPAGAPGNPFDLGDAGPSGGGGAFNPFDTEHGEQPAPAAPQPMPGYQLPPGYPYPYPVPHAGYPYPVPPGYYPPGYAPPGYGYPIPPQGYEGQQPAAPYPYPYPMPAATPLPPQVAGHPAHHYPAPAVPQQVPVAAAPTAPVQHAPAAAPLPAAAELHDHHHDFAHHDEPAAGVRPGGRYARGHGHGGSKVWAIVGGVFALVLVVGGVMGALSMSKKGGGHTAAGTKGGGEEHKGTAGSGSHGGGANTPVTRPDPKGGGGDDVMPKAQAGPVLPRRLLFIHLSRYSYLNPLSGTGADGGADRTKAAAYRMAYEWRIPAMNTNSQVFLLSDTAPPPDGRPAVKNVLAATFDQFFKTSRGQDRIVVYYGGHVVQKDGKAYLVPVEGDIEDEATLLPVADVYAKLKECKATQKVLIWDVCRFNPQRGRVRPGSEPMTKELSEALLAGLPPGVQVITTCQEGENALEFNSLRADGQQLAGSSFLEAFKYVGEKTKTLPKNDKPGDPIPVGPWAEAVKARVAEVAGPASQDVGGGAKFTQTVKLGGEEPKQLAAASPSEPPAARFTFPDPPAGANPADVAKIVEELNLPPLKRELAVQQADDFEVYPEDVLKQYADDVPVDAILKDKAKYPFQAKVLEAMALVKDVWAGGGESGFQIRETCPKVDEQLKKTVKSEQTPIGLATAKLELAEANLGSVAEMKKDMPKRWQAHYDWARAQVLIRRAYIEEYNLALGNIITETMPQLDPKLGHDGYKLVSAEKMNSKKEYSEMAEAGKEILDGIMKEHKKTPWATRAKREKDVALGLKWQPFNSQMADKDAPKQ